MPSPERVTSGLWTVDLQPGLKPEEVVDYLKLTGEISQLLTPGRFKLMEQNGVVCFMASHIWSKLSDIFPEFNYRGTSLIFNNPIPDAELRSEQTGQICLRIYKDNIPVSLTLDTAAYLFGFNYEEMPITIGDELSTGEMMSKLYSNKTDSPVSIKATFY